MWRGRPRPRSNVAFLHHLPRPDPLSVTFLHHLTPGGGGQKPGAPRLTDQRPSSLRIRADFPNPPFRYLCYRSRMISGICERCGHGFSGRSSVKRFCSEACRKATEHIRLRLSKPKPKAPRARRLLFVCSGCGGDVHKPARGRHPAPPLCSPCRQKSYKPTPGPLSEEAADRLRTMQRDRLRRYRQDPGFRFRQSISARIRQSLRGSKNSASWERLTGYRLLELRQHIERQFQDGMTWDNYGKWHVDHIVPVASFSYADPSHPDFKACWALTNLRPYWAEPNLSKGGRRTHLL